MISIFMASMGIVYLFLIAPQMWHDTNIVKENLVIELSDLNIKIERLKLFTSKGSAYHDLDADHKGLLLGQLEAMERYRDLLEDRIELLSGK